MQKSPKFHTTPRWGIEIFTGQQVLYNGGRHRQTGIHRVHYIKAGGCHSSWHGYRAGKSRMQLVQAREGILPKNHVGWIEESGQQPRLSPGASG
ncbi:hypothetical protein TNCV_474701 [Trichonephila clavipes]|nr:hypothetical protein TNCV_474701 [Trichonephila clavipes]